MEEILSIFKNDAFSATTLDRLAPNLPYVPTRISRLNLFQDKPIRTKTVEVWTENGVIQMVPTSERGAPEPTAGRGNSELRTLRTYRLTQRDRVEAHELQDLIRLPLGSPQQLAAAAAEVTERAAILRQNNEYTQEAHQLGALQGKILDADGVTVVRNFWTEFGIAEPAEIFFDFAAIPAGGLVEFITANIIRPMIRTLAGRANGNTRIAALVGDAFWGKLINHIDVRATYLNWEAAAALRQNSYGGPDNARGNAWGEFTFGGVQWINFMGTLNNDIAIGAEKARFFPIGATDVFRRYLSPGERMRDVNTLGQPMYVIIQPDPREQMQEFVDIIVRNYPLYACVFPGALLRGRSA
jgi:hypothetical protein